jgi:hypothetical protein
MILETFYPLHKGKEEGIPLQGYSWFLLNGIPLPRPSRTYFSGFTCHPPEKDSLFPFPRFRSPSCEEKFQGC